MSKFSLLLLPVIFVAASSSASIRSPCSNLESAEKIVSASHAAIQACLIEGQSEQLKQMLSELAERPLPAAQLAVDRAKAIFEELGVRREQAASDWRSWIRTLSINWDFEQIREIRKQPEGAFWFGSARFPLRIESSEGKRQGPTLFELRERDSALVEKLLAPEDVPDLLVVFSPTCSPCRRAARMIENDVQLSRIFSACSLWVSVLDHSFDFKNFIKWNNDHPTLKGSIVKDWRTFGLSYPMATPVFHLYASGQAVAEVKGWPQEGRKAELMLSLHASGSVCASKHAKSP